MKPRNGKAFSIVKTVLATVVVAALVFAGRKLVLRKKAILAAAPRVRNLGRLVDVTRAVTGSIAQTHDYLAIVEPWLESDISSRVTAAVDRVLVDEGSRVAAGDLLIELDHRQIDDQLAAVAAQIRQAQADLEANRATVTSLEKSYRYWKDQAGRDEKLARSNSIPAVQAETTRDKMNSVFGQLEAARKRSLSIEARIAAVKAKKSELETALSYCRISSAFDGVVTSRLVDPGDLAVPGKGLLIVQDYRRKKLAFQVPQVDLPEIRENLKVHFNLEHRRFEARISRLYPALDKARMLRAEVNLTEDVSASKALTLGRFLTVSASFNRVDDAVLVPYSAIVEPLEGDTTGPRVFVVDNEGKLRSRPVRVLVVSCGMAAVEGISSGDLVVRNSFLGWAGLSDGMKVLNRQRLAEILADRRTGRDTARSAGSVAADETDTTGRRPSAASAAQKGGGANR